MKKFKAAATALTVAGTTALATVGATAASLAIAAQPAYAANCVAKVADLGARGVRHASCVSGSGDVRVKIQCMDPSGMVYFKYGAWVYSDSVGDSSSAACNGQGSVMNAWAEKR